MKLAKKFDDEILSVLGQQMRERRKELAMTQGEVAKIVECSPQQIQKYEVGKSPISLPIFFKLCQALHTHPTRFFTSFAFAESQYNDDDENLEARLLTAFRSVDNNKVKERIVNLIEALISTSTI